MGKTKISKHILFLLFVFSLCLAVVVVQKCTFDYSQFGVLCVDLEVIDGYTIYFLPLLFFLLLRLR